MTSPAQLQYLNALGIPVWVSRDLVIADSLLSDASPERTSQETRNQEVNNQARNNQGNSENVAVSNQVIQSSTTNSVESILQGLEEQSIPTPRAAPKTRELEPTSPAPTLNTQIPINTSPTANEIARTGNHIVYACGSLKADWLVIGESPEINDNRLNQPFSGESGELLTNMLRAVGLDKPRESAYLVNVIKSSMQNTDDAGLQEESKIELNALLVKTIKEVKPKMVLLVGQLAAQNVLQSKEPLARLRAKPQTHSETNTDVIVTYYPTYLLSKPMDKRKAWDDLKLAMKILNQS